ncbi:MAG TPA: hypothetical protein VI757_01860 [Bacteroidia bacterium]|nr:hypothetical protein [Bacteroidia bacterium]
MKRLFTITSALLYLLSVSGVAVNYFYCCGKFKEAYIFNCKSTPKNCKGNKLPGCCETKTIIVKVKDSQSASHQLKVNTTNFSFNIFSGSQIAIESLISFSHSGLFALTHAPPFISKQPVYLAVNNFRI